MFSLMIVEPATSAAPRLPSSAPTADITLHKKLFRVAYSLKTSKPLNGAQMNQN